MPIDINGASASMMLGQKNKWLQQIILRARGEVNITYTGKGEIAWKGKTYELVEGSNASRKLIDNSGTDEDEIVLNLDVAKIEFKRSTGVKSVVKVDLPGVSDWSNMFAECYNITKIEEQVTIPDYVTIANDMFRGASLLRENLNPNFKLSNSLQSANSMFYYCPFPFPHGYRHPNSLISARSMYGNNKASEPFLETAIFSGKETALSYVISGTTNIKSVPNLDVFTAFYSNMLYGAFSSCPNMQGKVILNPTKLEKECLNYCFRECPKINDIEVHFSSWLDGSTTDWVKGVSPTGDFYCPADLPLIWDDSHIPIGWTAHPEGKEPVPWQDPNESKYLRFTAEQDGSLLRLDKSADDPSLTARLEYKINSGQWEEYTWGEDEGVTDKKLGHLISLPKVGDCVKWRAVDFNQTFCTGYNKPNYNFTGSGKTSLSGNLASLITHGDPTLQRSIPSDNYFRYLFSDNQSLKDVNNLVIDFDNVPSLALGDVFASSSITGNLKINVLQTNEYAFHLIAERTKISSFDLSTKQLKYMDLYGSLFECINLNNIKVDFHQWERKTEEMWVTGVSPHGTFTCPADLPVIFGDSNIPHGWTVDNGLTEVSEEEILNACYQYKNGRLIIQSDFKACLNRAEQIDYVKHGKTYWKAGTPLPNPHRTDIGSYYKMTNIFNAFNGFSAMAIIDLSEWDCSEVTNTDNAFTGCTSVTTAYARTQADCDKLNASSGKPTTWEFVIHPDLLNVPYFTVDGNLHFAKADDVNGYPQYVCRQDASTITFAPTEQADGSVRYVITQTSNGGHTATYVCDTPLDKPIDTTACTGKRQLLRDATYADASGAKHEFTFTFEAPPKPEPEPNVAEFWINDAGLEWINGHWIPNGNDGYMNEVHNSTFFVTPYPMQSAYLFMPSGSGVEFIVYPEIPELKAPENEGRQYSRKLLSQCREFETPGEDRLPFTILFENPTPP